MQAKKNLIEDKIKTADEAIDAPLQLDQLCVILRDILNRCDEIRTVTSIPRKDLPVNTVGVANIKDFSSNFVKIDSFAYNDR